MIPSLLPIYAALHCVMFRTRLEEAATWLRSQDVQSALYILADQYLKGSRPRKRAGG